MLPNFSSIPMEEYITYLFLDSCISGSMDLNGQIWWCMIVLTERSTQLEHKVTYHVNSRWKRPVETSTRMRSFENLKSSTTFSRSTINLNPELVASSSSILIPLEYLAGDIILHYYTWHWFCGGSFCRLAVTVMTSSSHTWHRDTSLRVVKHC